MRNGHGSCDIVKYNVMINVRLHHAEPTVVTPRHTWVPVRCLKKLDMEHANLWRSVPFLVASEHPKGGLEHAERVHHNVHRVHRRGRF